MPSPDPSGAASSESAGPATDALLTTVSRSGRVESVHRGALAVVLDGEPAFALGDVDAPVWARSAVKPLQALPFLERGLHGRMGLTDGEIAVMTASHQGTAAHVGAVRSLLARGGLDDSRLGCGPHAPFDAETRQRMLAEGQEPQRVHNNCSGKHAGFLHLARELGDELGRYLDPGSNAQTEVRAAVAAMAGVDPEIPLGVDGCGAPTFRLPLVSLARAFCRLANPSGQPAVRQEACRRLFSAVASEPVLLAGEGRLCTALVRALPGAVLPKNGAEGVYAVALRPDDFRRPPWRGAVGIAVKVRDGASRGYLPVIAELLDRLGVWERMPEELEAFRSAPVLDTRRERVGEVACAADWSRLV